MSRRQKVKKLARLEELEVQKAEIIRRREERMAPVYRFTRKFVVTLAATVFLLYVGLLINGHLHGITRRLISPRS